MVTNPCYTTNCNREEAVMTDSGAAKRSQSLSLFDNNHDEVPIRDIERDAAAAELNLRAEETQRSIDRLEEATAVTREILELEVSI